MSADLDGLLIRPGARTDLPSVGELYVRAREAAVPAMPPSVHTPASVRAWVRSWDLGVHELWVADAGEELVGFALATATWLDHLYVEPARTGSGVGSALLEVVKALRPGGVGLWVFESNVAARRFYERHGFVEVERTDGSGNEERAPDVHLAWPGPDGRDRG